MRIMDGMMSFPSLLIALLVLTSLGPNPINIAGTIGVVFIAPVARVMRSATLAVKSLEFVDAARLRGEPVIYNHLPRDTAQHPAGAGRRGVGALQLRDPAGRVAGVPRAGRAATVLGLGADDQREPQLHRGRAMGRACARHRGSVVGDRRQPAGRRHQTGQTVAGERRRSHELPYGNGSVPHYNENAPLLQIDRAVRCLPTRRPHWCTPFAMPRSKCIAARSSVS